MHLCKGIQGVGLQRHQLQKFWKHLDGQRKEGQLCDITFQCNGGEVSAHKCVLASVSDYFKALFTSPIATASSTNVVVFDDFSVEVITLLMDLIYSEVDIPPIHVMELLRLADYAQLHWLVDILVEDIRKQIDEQNVYDWYTAAEGWGFKKLKFLCECYVRENCNKLLLEDSNYFSDIKVDVQLGDTDYSREVVIIDTRDKHFLIDPKFNSIEMFNGDLTADPVDTTNKLTEFWTGKGMLFTAFVHGNVVYFVTSKGQSASEMYCIWKYQHASRNLDLVAELKRTELIEILLGDDFDDFDDLRDGLRIYQILYDGEGSLYVLCNLSRPVTQYVDSPICVFKLDVERYLFYEGYVLAEENNQIYHMAYIEGHKMCLVTPDYVISLEKCEFLVPGFHNVKIQLSRLPVNDIPRNTTIPNNSVEHLEWDSWRPVNKGGQFYCLVDDLTTDCFNLILKLDIDRRSWVLCDGREFQYLDEIDDGDGPKQMLFHCGSTLYRHWLDDGGSIQETSYLDEEESILKTVSFSPSVVYKEIISYVVIPYHVLL